MAKLAAGWTAWALATASLSSARDAVPLLLTDAADDCPSGVRMLRFPVRPVFVQGDTPESFFVLPGTPARVVRMADRSGGNAHARAPESALGCLAPVLELEMRGHEPVEAVYSMPDGAGRAGGYLLVVHSGALTLYRAARRGEAWWTGAPLVSLGHPLLVSNVTVPGVMSDFIVFSIAGGFWAFFPVQAVADQVPPHFAPLRDEAHGVLFQSPEDGDEQEIPPPPSWIRVGHPCALDEDARGRSLAVTLGDLGCTHVYARGDDGTPVMVGSAESRRRAHRAHVAHRRLDDGRYLLLRTYASLIEYRCLSTEPRDHEGAFGLGDWDAP